MGIVITKYRVKTESELREDGQWRVVAQKNGMPAMVKYLGQDIPNEHNAKCDKGSTLFLWEWFFTKDMYISKVEGDARTRKKSMKIEKTGEFTW